MNYRAVCPKQTTKGEKKSSGYRLNSVIWTISFGNFKYEMKFYLWILTLGFLKLYSSRWCCAGYFSYPLISHICKIVMATVTSSIPIRNPHCSGQKDTIPFVIFPPISPYMLFLDDYDHPCSASPSSTCTVLQIHCFHLIKNIKILSKL